MLLFWGVVYLNIVDNFVLRNWDLPFENLIAAWLVQLGEG